MKNKEALKIVLDLARKYVFARYWQSVERNERDKNEKLAETSLEEASAIEAVAAMVGKKLDAQKSQIE